MPTIMMSRGFKVFINDLGMDDKTARYFAAGRRKVVDVCVQGNYRILLTFDNGERRLLDCSHLLTPESIFHKIARPQDFDRVAVDECGNLFWDIDPQIDSSKAWNNRLDICRDACYLQSEPI